ncbi:GFA family protein [Devosia sp.]|uniref:GFA family protein n=1 Tax=Devosia sp. TaxID=1871048 RepID=UPI003A8D03BE
MNVTHVSCACGRVELELTGKAMVNAECCCTSCREGSTRIEALPGAPQVRTPLGTTRYVLYRKDRVRFSKGAELLREFYLTPQSKTRRVVAGCCNSPVFLEFKGGHWLSLYGSLWSENTLPPLEMRTMASDWPELPPLPTDVPNHKTQSGSFFFKLLTAWIAMGFRVPKIAVAKSIDA